MCLAIFIVVVEIFLRSERSMGADTEALIPCIGMGTLGISAEEIGLVILATECELSHLTMVQSHY